MSCHKLYAHKFFFETTRSMTDRIKIHSTNIWQYSYFLNFIYNCKLLVDVKLQMSAITQSGLYQDSTVSGQQFLVTQGLSGYTLVDKKKILFRLFLHPTNLVRVNAVFARIKYGGVDIPNSEILIPYKDLIIENSTPNGPSIGIIFQGNIFPSASIRYFVEFYILYSDGPTGRFAISDLKFQKSGRLRVLTKSIQSITGTAPWGNKILSNPF